MFRFLFSVLVSSLLFGCATVQQEITQTHEAKWTLLPVDDLTVVSVDTNSFDLSHEGGEIFIELVFQIRSTDSRINGGYEKPVSYFENTAVVNCMTGDLLLTRIKAVATNEVLFEVAAAKLMSPPYIENSPAYVVVTSVCKGLADAIHNELNADKANKNNSL